MNNRLLDILTILQEIIVGVFLLTNTLFVSPSIMALALSVVSTLIMAMFTWIMMLSDTKQKMIIISFLIFLLFLICSQFIIILGSIMGTNCLISALAFLLNAVIFVVYFNHIKDRF